MDLKVNENLLRDLEKIGIKDDDNILIHTSFSRLKNITPKELCDTLLYKLKDKGTVVFPSFSYEISNKNNPYFDVSETPSNIGFFPEFVRKNYDFKRSLCPTHSCIAFGKNATYITESHIKDITPCGENSPFYKLKNLNGKILFLGLSGNTNTMMHAVEELYRPCYLFKDPPEVVTYTIIDKDKNVIKKDLYSHYFKGTVQRYERLIPLLKNVGVGEISSAKSYLIDINEVFFVAGKYYKKDPLYFVDMKK